MSYKLVLFDIDGTLCPSGKILTPRELSLIDSTHPKAFKDLNLRRELNYPCFDGMEDCLKELKNSKIELGVVSNAPSFRQKNKLIASGIDELFNEDLVIISENLAPGYYFLDTGLVSWPDKETKEEYVQRVSKPKACMFCHAFSKTNHSRDSIVYVGNQFEDSVAAQAAGVSFIRVIDKEKPDFKSEWEINQNEFYKLISLLNSLSELANS